jgi:hypothetical protein
MIPIPITTCPDGWMPLPPATCRVAAPLAERIRHREQVERDYERYRRDVCDPLQAAADAAHEPEKQWDVT